MMEIASAMYNMPEFVVSSNELDYQGMEDTTSFEELPMDYFDGLDFQSFISNSSYQNPQSIVEPPAQRPSKMMQVKSNKPAFASRLISFENSNNNTHQFYNMGSNGMKLETPNELENVMNFASINERMTMNMAGTVTRNPIQAQDHVMAGTVTRNPIQAQDHVMAERRRREKLNQKFIALSSIIPGLKKMDKASVLGDAIEYVKQLKEREKILEEQVAMKGKESAVLTRRSILFAGNDEISLQEALAEMEARVLGKEVLIRIQCEKQSGCEAKILRELLNLRLTVKSSSILPFGETTLCITIIAQMEKENSMTAKDLVGSLRKALTLYDE